MTMGCAQSVIEFTGLGGDAAAQIDLPQLVTDAQAGVKPETMRRIIKTINAAMARDSEYCLEFARLEGTAGLVTQWISTKESRTLLGGLHILEACCKFEPGAKVLCNQENIAVLHEKVKNKDRAVVRLVMHSLQGFASLERNRALMGDEGTLQICAQMLKTKDLELLSCVLAILQLLTIEQPLADKFCEEQDHEQLQKVLFETMKKDDTAVEKNALLLVGRLVTVAAFADRICNEKNGDRLKVLLAHARDNIPSRKLAATLSIVNMSLHKELRMVMVRKRALQLFVELGRIESQRADQAEYQRVAATGISRLCTNFQMRDLAAKVGVLEVVMKMLGSTNLEVKRAAARACAELTLHEENGRRLALSGAIRPLLDMARSGDRLAESDAILAINNMAITEANQNQIMQEGGKGALAYLKVHQNLGVAKMAENVIKRVRMNKLRSAARFAGKLALAQKRTEGEGEGGEGKKKDEDEDEDSPTKGVAYGGDAYGGAPGGYGGDAAASNGYERGQENLPGVVPPLPGGNALANTLFG